MAFCRSTPSIQSWSPSKVIQKAWRCASRPKGDSPTPKWLLTWGEGKKSIHNFHTVDSSVGWGETAAVTVRPCPAMKVSLRQSRESALEFEYYYISGKCLVYLSSSATWPQTGLLHSREQTLPTRRKQTTCRWLDQEHKQLSHKNSAYITYIRDTPEVAGSGQGILHLRTLRGFFFRTHYFLEALLSFLTHRNRDLGKMNR